MARIVLGSYMVRYPLGGMLSWVLQYLRGFQLLGHEVWFVEKSGYPRSCFDPSAGEMTDDCTYGVRAVSELLGRFDLGDRWCFVDAGGRYHGTSRASIEDVLRTADVFVDMGTHGAWSEEAAQCPCRVLVDGEPGFTQMKIDYGMSVAEDYDFYYTTGRNIPLGASAAPDAGKPWRPLFHPVAVEDFTVTPPPAGAPYTTVMNWQSYEPLSYRGRTYGHKDVEFAKFEHLPQLVRVPLEIAVSGRQTPRARLVSSGWRLQTAHEVTLTFDAFVGYVNASRGEFSVCKDGYVATRCGWFSDRSAVFLACGRPVVMQDTGFGDHLPCGEGLFAARDAGAAAAAIAEIERDWKRHAAAAREIARAHLDARVVLSKFLDEVGSAVAAGST